jgi:hypothetical protein
MLIRANRNYHSCHWPHARQGDKVWGDEWLLTRLQRDAGQGAFSVLQIEGPDGPIHIEAHGDGQDHPDRAQGEAKEEAKAPEVNDGEKVNAGGGRGPVRKAQAKASRKGKKPGSRGSRKGQKEVREAPVPEDGGHGPQEGS